MVRALKYLNMREEFADYLAVLCNAEVSGTEGANNSFDNYFDEAIHFIFDDTVLGENPDKAIGWFLFDKIESQLVIELTIAIDELFTKYGKNLSGSAYRSKPEWAQVIITSNSIINKLKV